MPNGIRVDEDTFAKMEHDDQIKSIFHAIVTTNENFCKQPELCEIRMDKKIKTNNKLHRRINFGIGSGGGISIVAIFELARHWLNSG